MKTSVHTTTHFKHIANVITGIRILCSLILLFCPVLSVLFYSLYITAGITDMIDGTMARKTGSASEFGAKFDTVADFIFIVICLIKLIPVLNLQKWMCIWIAVIAIIKVTNIVSGFAMHKKLVSVHSFMNKTTGMILFLLPLTLKIIALKYSVLAVLMVATFAAVQEGHFIRTGREK